MKLSKTSEVPQPHHFFPYFNLTILLSALYNERANMLGYMGSPWQRDARGCEPLSARHDPSGHVLALRWLWRSVFATSRADFSAPPGRPLPPCWPINTDPGVCGSARSSPFSSPPLHPATPPDPLLHPTLPFDPYLWLRRGPPLSRGMPRNQRRVKQNT